MTIIYKLNIDLVGRAAAQLVWQLKQINTSIYIVTERMINAKSLVGLLSGNFEVGESIKIILEDKNYCEKIKEIFNEYGQEVI